jgi:hypothetical protein
VVRLRRTTGPGASGHDPLFRRSSTNRAARAWGSRPRAGVDRHGSASPRCAKAAASASAHAPAISSRTGTARRPDPRRGCHRGGDRVVHRPRSSFRVQEERNGRYHAPVGRALSGGGARVCPEVSPTSTLTGIARLYVAAASLPKDGYSPPARRAIRRSSLKWGAICSSSIREGARRRSKGRDGRARRRGEDLGTRAGIPIRRRERGKGWTAWIRSLKKRTGNPVSVTIVRGRRRRAGSRSWTSRTSLILAWAEARADDFVPELCSRPGPRLPTASPPRGAGRLGPGRRGREMGPPFRMGKATV